MARVTSRIARSEIEMRHLEITHPSKTMFTDPIIQKDALVQYYRRIAPVMLPYLMNKPYLMFGRTFSGGLGTKPRSEITSSQASSILARGGQGFA